MWAIQVPDRSLVVPVSLRLPRTRASSTASTDKVMTATSRAGARREPRSVLLGSRAKGGFRSDEDRGYTHEGMEQGES